MESRKSVAGIVAEVVERNKIQVVRKKNFAEELAGSIGFVSMVAIVFILVHRGVVITEDEIVMTRLSYYWLVLPVITMVASLVTEIVWIINPYNKRIRIRIK